MPKIHSRIVWAVAVPVLLGSFVLGVFLYLIRPDGPPEDAPPELAAADAPPESGTGLEKSAQDKGKRTSIKPLGTRDRQFLWEVEHHGNLLNKYGFSVLAKALRENNEKDLEGLLTAAFVGEVFQHPTTVRADTNYASVFRKEQVDTPPARLSATELIATLLKYRGMYRRPPQVSLALKKLTPPAEKDGESPWHGLAQLRMAQAKGQAPPLEVILYFKFQVVKPAKERLRQGRWLSACAIVQAQVASSQKYLMREVAAERGIATQDFHNNWKSKGRLIPHPGGAYLCDYNRDGILDLLIVDINKVALYQGRRDGTFKDVTVEVGLPAGKPRGPLAAFVDIDGDGWEDLILDRRVYRNEGGKKFTDYTSKVNLSFPEDTIGIAVADYDRDGLADLYLIRQGLVKPTSWLADDKADRVKGKQTLWHNKGNWQFEDATAESGTDGGNRSVFSAVWLDADNDGWPDLYVINEFGRGVLYMNNGDGSFRRRYLTEGVGDFGSMGVVAGDFDGDGNIDLYVANMYSKAGSRLFSNFRPGTFDPAAMAKVTRMVKGSQLHRNLGGLKFEQLGEQYHINDVGWSYGAVLADLDNDGWLDIYATCGFMSQSRTGLDA